MKRTMIVTHLALAALLVTSVAQGADQAEANRKETALALAEARAIYAADPEPHAIQPPQASSKPSPAPQAATASEKKKPAPPATRDDEDALPDRLPAPTEHRTSTGPRQEELIRSVLGEGY